METDNFDPQTDDNAEWIRVLNQLRKRNLPETYPAIESDEQAQSDTIQPELNRGPAQEEPGEAASTIADAIIQSSQMQGPQKKFTTKSEQKIVDPSAAISALLQREKTLKGEVETAKEKRAQYLAQEKSLPQKQAMMFLPKAPAMPQEQLDELNKAQEYVKKFIDEKPVEPQKNLLAEALLQFGPALLGMGIGALSKTTGGAGYGLAAGASAGSKALDEMKKDEEHKTALKKQARKENIKAAIDLLKLKQKEILDPAQSAQKSYNSILAASLIDLTKGKIAEAINAAKAAGTKDPELEALSKDLAEAEKRLTDISGEIGKVVGGKKIETTKGTERTTTTPKPSAQDKPRKMTAQQAEQLSAYDASKKQLERILDLINKNKDIMGPVYGRLGAANPYATRAQTLNANLIASTTAIAKAAEKGRLSDQDWVRAALQSGQIKDTPEVAIQKVKDAIERLEIERKSFLGEVSKSFSVPNVVETKKQPASGLTARQLRIQELRKKLGK